ncbi:nuclear fragile X mental retardation-interacting protein 1-domain-containing protein [Irpex rosettiformis]|uniref:Nuclear fragile X mental retardation-interacting protein 1-domain-containing protein n=1 Tax=Irpex rosettiformis TaxID=378272 RepID=A0ACB8UK99_9APHY|nr:nuclear fragile X mental retardation-interacting protein 1-domain-containing protein [Irpex rosettiformis]
MQPWHGAPSLPVAPQQSLQGGHQPQPYSQSTQQQWQYGMSSHYAQAYMQYNYALGSQSIPTPMLQASTSQSQLPNLPPSSRWYQPGNARCKKQGCSFIGSQKAVETHMMDRHLIYPPGWEHRKRKDDWDADPSLKGKPIPIQGCALKLDTPEAIQQWIAERRKRFPTASRIEEKQQKMQEASARGQLTFPEQRFPNKKRRLDNERLYVPVRGGKTRGLFRGRGRGGMHIQRIHDSSYISHATTPKFITGSDSTAKQLPHETSHPSISDANSSDRALDSANKLGSESDSDGPPEVASSKVLADTIDMDAASEINAVSLKAVRKPLPKQPRRLPQNSFASRPALLRNLLLPEIRMTVSNLSQAIRFLVDNNFLENVELKPGQSDQKLIQVLDESVSTPIVATKC